jgi:hypothetical protein
LPTRLGRYWLPRKPLHDSSCLPDGRERVYWQVRKPSASEGVARQQTTLAVADIGVVYLCRFAEGEGPVCRFLQSYENHPAGIDHDLHVLFKGFPGPSSLASMRALFGDLTINPILLADVDYDIGSYIAAAGSISNRRVIFLNTFSQILTKDWLRYFDLALNHSAVGVVGATGSWQANASGDERAIKTILHNVAHLPSYIHQTTLPKKRTGGAMDEQRRKRPLGRYLFFPFYYLLNLYEFGRYPNPHIRTNAFMIERERFLGLRRPSFTCKRGVLKFESGRLSMTRQILKHGLRPVIVDCGGNVYDVPEWRSSSTFHAGGQKNLIIGDRRTHEYSVASPEFRRFLESQAWANPWLWVP